MDYYAECINKCIKGIGTNDERLMQLIVSRCEVLEKGVASHIVEKIDNIWVNQMPFIVD